MRRTWTANERIQVIENYAERGAVALAATLGRSADSVSSQARRHGVVSCDYRHRQGRTRAAKSSTVNTRFFETTTPATAFVVGYIWACGSVKHKHRKVLRIACPYGNTKQLRRIRDLMGSRHEIQTYEYRHVLELCNSRLTESLVERFGWPPGRQRDGNPPYLADAFMARFAAGHLAATGTQGDEYVRWNGHPSVIARIASVITAQLKVPPPAILNDRVRRALLWRGAPSVRAIRAWLESEE